MVKIMTPIDFEILEKIQNDYTVYDGFYPRMTKEWCVLNRAIKELKEIVPKRVYEHEHDLRKRFETEIIRLEAIINNQWIFVEEKLPEERHAVLVYCPERKNIYCAYHNKKKWWVFGADNRQIELEIVAWKPLPIPPSYKLCDTNPFNDERFGG